MVKWLFISFICWSILGSVCLLWSFVLFDRMLRQLYSASHEEWVNVGMPMGFFWIPEEMKSKSSFKPTITRSSLYISRSKSLGSWKCLVDATNYGAFKVAKLLGQVCFGAGLVCLGLVVLAILF
jgi:hypothetical protein